MACDRMVSDLMLPLWEEVLWPFSGCMEQCASTQNLSAVERPRKVRAVWRALLLLLLPSGEGANGPQGAESVWPSIRPHGELLLLLMQKKPTLVPESEAFNSYIGDGFLIPELKDGSEASKDE